MNCLIILAETDADAARPALRLRGVPAVPDEPGAGLPPGRGRPGPRGTAGPSLRRKPQHFPRRRLRLLPC